MNDISPVLLSICGVLAICFGLMLVGALLMYRLLRVNIFSMAMGYFMRHTGDEVEPDPIVTRAQEAHDLRAKAQSLDFDAAVARYRDDKKAPAGQSTNLRPTTVNDFEGFKPSDRVSDTRSSSRRRREPNEDEIFGGYLDADGDGDVDF